MFLKLSQLPVRTRESSLSSFKSLGSEFQTGNIARQIERFLLDRYTPVSVIINEHGKIVYIHGRTGKYLEPSTGQPSWNMIEMAREGLRLPLVSALRIAAKKGETEITIRGLEVKTNGDFETIDLKLEKIVEPEALRDLFLVFFLPRINESSSQVGWAGFFAHRLPLSMWWAEKRCPPYSLGMSKPEKSVII